MFRRLDTIFTRYAAVHLNAAAPGFPLTDYHGRLVGNVDVVEVRGGRLRVAGWVQAAHVTLRGPAAEASAQPTLMRQDVADRLGLDPQLGFDLTIDRSTASLQQLAVLMVTPHGFGATPLFFGVPMPAVSSARRRLWPRFLKAVAVSAPAIVLWRITRSPHLMAAVKSNLGMDAVPRDGSLLAPLAPAEGPPPATDVPIAIVLPVYNAFDLLPEALERVVAHTDLPWTLLVVEDASPDGRVRPFLREWAARRGAEDGANRVELIENDANLGFIGSVNRGLARARELGRHVVLLNSDAMVPAGWASRLLAPIAADPTVATVTPMSNDAEIFSAPVICETMPLDPGQADAIDAVARGLDPVAATAAAPTGVGFCMAMNARHLKRLPELDPAFGRGYGEEVDWCQRARALGGRNLGTAALFVEHRGGASFGSEAKRKALARNGAIVSRRYPAYDGEVQAFIRRDPLLSARLLLAVGWAAAWSDARAARLGDGEALVPVYLAHSLGGGAELYLQRRIDDDLARSGRPSVVVRVGGHARWRVEFVGPSGVTAGTTDDDDLVRSLLRPLARRQVVYSCAVGDRDPASIPAFVLSLAEGAERAEVQVLVHDFYSVSPSYTLLDSSGAYRGPVVAGRPNGSDPAHQALRRDGTRLDLAGWQAAWRPLLRAASEVTVFSDSSRDLVLAAYPEVEPCVRVRPHELPVDVPPCPAPRTGRRVVAALGNIGAQKGARLLVELASLVPSAGPPGRAVSQVVLVGNIDPAHALPPQATIHGSYRVSELPALVARYGITDWLIPSIWPETFSYTTHEALRTGLPVYAYDIGGQGEAVRRAPNGIAMRFAPGAQSGKTLLEELTAERDVQPAKSRERIAL